MAFELVAVFEPAAAFAVASVAAALVAAAASASVVASAAASAAASVAVPPALAWSAALASEQRRTNQPKDQRRAAGPVWLPVVPAGASEQVVWPVWADNSPRHAAQGREGPEGPEGLEGLELAFLGVARDSAEQPRCPPWSSAR